MRFENRMNQRRMLRRKLRRKLHLQCAALAAGPAVPKCVAYVDGLIIDAAGAAAVGPGLQK